MSVGSFFDEATDTDSEDSAEFRPSDMFAIYVGSGAFLRDCFSCNSSPFGLALARSGNRLSDEGVTQNLKILRLIHL